MGQDNLKTFLQSWRVEPVYTFRRGLTRTWIVSAENKPIHKLLQHNYGLAVSKEAQPRRRPANSTIERLQPQRTQHAKSGKEVLPRSWATVVKEAVASP